MPHAHVRPGGGRQALILGLFFAGVFLAAAIGSAFTVRSVATWYATLAKPAWTPPAWVFGPVWTALYIMMAVAGWCAWRTGNGGRALAWFAVQLALNVLWSALFFGLRLPGVAAVEIVVLWVAVLGTTIEAWRVSRPAGALLAPYLLWVTFAAGLNATIWQLNQ